MLLQKRAAKKYHSAGLWTNACCSHPRPGEPENAAAKRRLQEELGFTTVLKKAFDFTYKASFENGLTEHEFDHVLPAYMRALYFQSDEVEDYCFKSMDEIENALALKERSFYGMVPHCFSLVKEWCFTEQLTSK